MPSKAPFGCEECGQVFVLQSRNDFFGGLFEDVETLAHPFLDNDGRDACESVVVTHAPLSACVSRVSRSAQEIVCNLLLVLNDEGFVVTHESVGWINEFQCNTKCKEAPSFPGASTSFILMDNTLRPKGH